MERKNPSILKSSLNVNSWTIEDLPKAQRVIFSWNAKRNDTPVKFSLSLLYDTWTPPHIFCEWGKTEQSSFSYDDPFQRFQFFQDELLLLAEPPRKIKVEIVEPEGYIIKCFFASFFSSESFYLLNHLEAPSIQLTPKWHYSQIELKLPYSHRICSPISLINASSFLLSDASFDIPSFVAKVYDKNFDIYGNWMLNTAHAATFLPQLEPKVERVASFQEVIEQLRQGKPVVASVSGHLTNAPLIYSHGHLLVIYGWDNEEKKILCVDSAAENHQGTLIKYPYHEFIESWSKKFNLCYTF